ncbi:MAG: DUF1214 domain-containing protein [Maricaulaceae bacterium]
MKKTCLYLIVLILGLVFGGVSALWASGLIGTSSIAKAADVNVKGWASDWSIGAPSADAYTRARVAQHGLLALSKAEAIYFTRNVDEDGAPLLEGCDYELSGGPQKALWWSITLYDAQSRLPGNDDDALSIDATQMGSGAWSAHVSPNRPETGHWISSRNAGQFDMTLRLYRPEAEVISAPERALAAPTIRKLSCGDAS